MSQGVEESWVRDVYVRSYPQLISAIAHIADATRGETEEAVQDAFLRLLQKSRGGLVPESPEAWVRKVALDALSNRRRKVRNGLRALRRIPPVAETSEASDDGALDLRRALGKLPQDQRTALVLHYYLDLPVREVALELGCPESTVKSHLLRGRRALHSQLAPLEES